MRSLVDQILVAVINPKKAAERITNLRLNDLSVVQAAMFVAICSTIFTYIFLQIIVTQTTVKVNDSTVLLNEVLSYVSSIQPLYFAANQVFQMVVFSVIITVGGKIFNGKGKFFEALICITMVESILILLKVLQLILLPFSSLLAFAVIIPGVIWSLWAFASVAAFIHGFRSTLLTFCGGFALSMLFFVSLNLFY
ncbi:MAG: hypothetical protein P8M50_01145 [Paracoccaceae bacterium]|nr:hypothetical protein [Paracoccaceae bacterium]